MKLIEKLKSKLKHKEEEKSSNIIMLPVVSHEQRYMPPEPTDRQIRMHNLIEENKRKFVQCISVFVMIYLFFIVVFGQSIYFMNSWKKAEEKVSELNSHISKLTNENEDLIERVAELEEILNNKSETHKQAN